ncbi:MAG: hypothetical protein WDA42_09760 [Candidatus Bathyarchaeia archaeon]
MKARSMFRYNLRTLVLASDWSTTQTITIADSSTTANSDTSTTPKTSDSPSQNPTATPNQSAPQKCNSVKLGLDADYNGCLVGRHYCLACSCGCILS